MDTLPRTHPLSCPRCGCPESKVIETRRMDRSSVPQPLGALKRTRRCEHCQKQYRTNETVEEVAMASSVWRCRKGSVVVDASQIEPGEYSGEWTDHVVTVTIEGVEYELDTRNPMRAIRQPCQVEVNGQAIVVESGAGPTSASRGA